MIEPVSSRKQVFWIFKKNSVCRESQEKQFRRKIFWLMISLDRFRNTEASKNFESLPDSSEVTIAQIWVGSTIGRICYLSNLVFGKYTFVKFANWQIFYTTIWQICYLVKFPVWLFYWMANLLFGKFTTWQIFYLTIWHIHYWVHLL